MSLGCVAFLIHGFDQVYDYFDSGARTITNQSRLPCFTIKKCSLQGCIYNNFPKLFINCAFLCTLAALEGGSQNMIFSGEYGTKTTSKTNRPVALMCILLIHKSLPMLFACFTLGHLVGCPALRRLHFLHPGWQQARPHTRWPQESTQGAALTMPQDAHDSSSL